MLLCGLVAAQYPGNGVSKSTYSCNDLIKGYKFINKYFQVGGTPEDECTDNLCVCAAKDGVPEWKIQQGRVYMSNPRAPDSAPGVGLGMHLVNVTNHLTTGGLSTARWRPFSPARWAA